MRKLRINPQLVPVKKGQKGINHPAFKGEKKKKNLVAFVADNLFLELINKAVSDGLAESRSSLIRQSVVEFIRTRI